MPSSILPILIALVAVIAIPAAIIYFIVRRGFQMRDLCNEGVKTTGSVTNKRYVRVQSGDRRKVEKLSYQYTDSAGQTHSHTSVVSQAVYDQYEDGQPIQIVYSSKNPQVSAPLYLVEQCRQALAK